MKLKTKDKKASKTFRRITSPLVRHFDKHSVFYIRYMIFQTIYVLVLMQYSMFFLSD